MKLPNAELAIVDIRKLRDYSLNLGNMQENFELLDVVTLTVDLPERNLWRGQVGTIVEILANGQAFEVEFSDREGYVYQALGLRPDQIMRLRFEPAPPTEQFSTTS